MNSTQKETPADTNDNQDEDRSFSTEINDLEGWLYVVFGALGFINYLGIAAIFIIGVLILLAIVIWRFENPKAQENPGNLKPNINSNGREKLFLFDGVTVGYLVLIYGMAGFIGILILMLFGLVSL